MVEELAQQLLNELHELRLQDLYNTNFQTKKELADEISLAKRKLRAIKKKMKDETTSIKSRWDNRASDEAATERMYLAMYLPLENLIEEIDVYLKEFEVRGNDAGEPPQFGTLYDGVLEEAEWHIFTPLEYMDWHIKRLIETKNQALEILNGFKGSIQHHKSEIKIHQNALTKFITLGDIIRLIPAILILVLLVSLYNVEPNQRTGSFLALTGLFCLMPLTLAHPIYRFIQNRRNHHQSIESRQKQIEDLISQAQKTKKLLSDMKATYTQLTERRNEILGSQ
jgi:hypothetical protein